MNNCFKANRYYVVFACILSFFAVILFIPHHIVQASCASPLNEIEGENCLPGNPASEWDVSGAGNDNIQGYATDISVDQGQTIQFKVNTNSSNYRLDIYRLGYYGGLGARKAATVQPSVTLPQSQPACLFDNTNAVNLLDCGNWNVSASWTVPATAVSGIYVAKLVREDATAGASHITFIVRDDDGGSDLLFQTSDTTWQAYNDYGGYSLYQGYTGHANKVSYNRPFRTRTNSTEDFLFNSEYPMIRWLERNGYDVSYSTDLDTDRRGAELLEHKVFMSVGHDEYWSAGQRAAVEAARAAGKHLAFFSGNEIYWKTRWEPSTDISATPYRTLVSYKEGSLAPGEHYNCNNNYACDPDPAVWTGLWRDGCGVANHDGCKPENALSGNISWMGTSLTMQVPSIDGDMRFWRNSPIASATTTTDLAPYSLGYEWDFEQYQDSYPAGRFWLSTTDSGGRVHHLSLYKASSGALVFGAGTVQWPWGLDVNHDRVVGSPTEDKNMQQATVNLFADMGVQPAALQAGLTAATASDDTTKPASSITSPTGGTTVSGLVTITGTATDNGMVSAVEVSVDGGTTWKAASGRATWSYSWTATTPGSVTIRSRAVDDSGNIEIPSAGITVTVGTRTCPCSIWEGTGTPLTLNDTDSQPIEVGVKFQTTVAGYITGLRFYKGSQSTGTHTGHLWSSTGTQLAEAVFSGESASGWQEVTLSTPVAVTANTTYVASYHSSNNYYASSVNYFTAAVDNPPVRALINSTGDPNGVYKLGASGFPNLTYNASNYWVDVVFNTTVAADTTPPVVIQVTPASNASNVPISANISAVFNESLDPASVSTATFELRNGANPALSATVTYNISTRTATLDPSASLAYSTQYNAKLVSGSAGVKNAANIPLAADYTWTFTTASPPPPPPDEGPGGPILVISSAANPFSRYYAEILRAEGLNEFTATDISNVVNLAYLSSYDVVILGEMTLTPAQVTVFTDWVNAGGNLIAMRPDPQLATLLGLTDTTPTLSNAYLSVNTVSGPGVGIVNQTIQFHGDADLYTLNGATSVATLYSNATTATSNPAVTLRSVGSSGGQAAAFTYDLAKSIIYTRQGNPAWVDTNGDGSPGPVRADDLFHQGTGVNWVNLDKVAIPQADEQQRLLANMILSMNMDQSPLPRFWYFPRGEKAVVLMTADDHANANVPDRLVRYLSLSPSSCSVENWECIRSSVYIYPLTALSSAQADDYNAQGFEIGVHIDTGCNNYTQVELATFYTDQLAAFAARFPGLPKQDSERTHCIAWSGWAFQPNVKAQKGVRLDTNYYYWPDTWIGNRPGMFTGSGMPMRFANLDGSMIDVYQAATQMTDESGQTFPYTIDTLLARALGSEGYYGVFTANMHTDSLTSLGSEAIIASAKANSVPVVSGRQLLAWLDGRNASSFSNITWTGATNTLSFAINANSGANGLQAMLPMRNGNKILSSLTAGSTVPYTVETIKGVSYARFAASSGTYSATFAEDTTAPEVSVVSPISGATGVAVNTTVTAQFSEPIDALTLNAGGFELRNTATTALVTATISYDAATRTATLTPNAALAPSTQYTAKLKGGSGGVSDVAGNPLAVETTWSFTTAANICPCSIWNNTSNVGTNPADANSYELGVKFRSSQDGYITALRFYKYPENTGEHIGRLWNINGDLLGSAIFTNETTSGWQEVALNPPVAVTADTVYVASYSTTAGNYAFSGNYFTSQGVDSAPLRALSAPESPAPGANGILNGTPGAFPNESYSDANYWVDVVFNTTDTNPPVISALSATPGSEGTTATITWTTDEPARSRVDYGTAPAALTSNVIDLGLVTAHNLSLTGLTPGMTYYYRVTSVDPTNNSATSPLPPAPPASFTTLSPDTTPPVISNVTAVPGANGTATITWTTDEVSDSSVAYGTAAGSLSLNAADAAPVTSHSLTLSNLSPTTTYYFRVTSTNAVNLSATSPILSDQPLTFTTLAASFTDSTVANFGAGTLGTCAVDATIGDGALRLPAVVDEDFSGASLPAGWSSAPWTGGTSTVGGGSLIVDGALAAPIDYYSPGRSIEFVATFGAATFQNAGFGQLLASQNGEYWAVFGTWNTTDKLYARTNLNNVVTNVEIAAPSEGSWIGESHKYRIDWTPTEIRFYIDDSPSPIVTQLVAITNNMRPVVSDYQVGGPVLSVDWLRMTPYASPCSFESRIFDAGAPANWGTLSWTGSTPAGTNLALSYRIGNTATPDGSWTAFVPVASSPASLAGNSRYIQYRANLTTSDLGQTPTLNDVTITYALGNETVPPTITGRSPAANTTGVSVSSNVVVTFSELIDVNTLTTSSFRLRRVGAGSDVSAVVTLAGNVATLNPAADLAPLIPYQVTVAGSVADLAGNLLGADDTWTFTTGAILGSVTDTSTADFGFGTLDSCVVDPAIGDGSVRLSAGVNENFSVDGATLPAGWTSHSWGGPNPTIVDGKLTLGGAEAYYPNTGSGFGPGKTLEFSATFGNQSNQHIGFGGTSDPAVIPYNDPPWIIISTGGGDGSQLYARVGASNVGIGDYRGTQRLYRIEWKPSSIDFYVDDILKTTINATISDSMRIAASDALSGDGNLTIDWIRLSPPYIPTCSFTSRVIDAGQSVAWDNMTWAGITPGSTSLALSYRIGSSPTVDGTWPTTFTSVTSSPAALAGSSRYIQYQVDLSSTNDPNQTPILESVTFNYHLNPTSANLNYFRAGKDPAGVLLAWETVSEATTAGFDLYRRESGGEFVKINTALIPPQVGGQPQGAAYTYLDTGTLPGQLYEYKLEIIGTKLQVEADLLATYWPYAISLPLLVR